jgi:calcineurin-like phosphoesterase
VQPPTGPGTACGVLIEVDPRTGLARRVAMVVQGPHLDERWPK